jgi:hypothetical protein
VPSKQGRYSDAITSVAYFYLRVISSEVASGVDFLPNFTLRGNNERSYSHSFKKKGGLTDKKVSPPGRTTNHTLTSRTRHHHGTPATTYHQPPRRPLFPERYHLPPYVVPGASLLGRAIRCTLNARYSGLSICFVRRNSYRTHKVPPAHPSELASPDNFFPIPTGRKYVVPSPQVRSSKLCGKPTLL